jgi:DNA polymerase-3 subunit gamma/tau
MSYEALALKWRPKSFKDVVGQSHVVTTLQNAIAAGKIHHAYLFSGPRGTGKTTIARILAKTINCADPYAETEFSKSDKPEPCNQCTNCKEISNGNSLDVIEMDAASNRGIDEIRELKENVILAPASCKYKVYIIDEAHMLTPEASNALLKTLEEPPKHVIFILATTERHKILPTILSRCQNFDFRYLTYSQLIERLREICDVEGHTVDDDGLSLIAQQSEGCLRDAENILEQLVASSNGEEVKAEDASRLLGFGSYQLMEQLVTLLIERDAKGCLQTLATLTEQGADLTQCLKNLITHFRSLRLLKHDLKQEIHASKSKLNEMILQAKKVSFEQLEKIIAIFMKASSDIKQYGYEQYNLESALINACSIQDSVPLSEALDKLTELQSKIEQLLSNQNQSLVDSTFNKENPPCPPLRKGGQRGDFQMPSTPSEANKQTNSDLLPKSVESDSPGNEVKKDLEPKLKATKVYRTAPTDNIKKFDANSAINAIWEALLERIENDKKSILRAHLNSVNPVNFDGNEFTIEFETSAHRNMFDEDDKSLIANYLSDMTGKRIRVEVTVSKTESNTLAKLTNHKPQEMTWLKLKSEAEQDEEVQLAMKFFNGEIIDVKL